MLIKVRVKTNERKESVEEKDLDRLIVCLREKPERNEANRRLVTVIAEHFNLPTSSVNIISGHTRPSKIVQLRVRVPITSQS